MSRRFGKKRVPDCECTESFTCRKCLDAGMLTVPAVHAEPRKLPPRQLISSDEAVEAKGQHDKPCSDCPWARKSLAGWLGGIDRQTWLQAAHGEDKIECHVLKGAQCAGSSIYRANVCKSPRDPSILRLKADGDLVFKSPREFLAHHKPEEG